MQYTDFTDNSVYMYIRTLLLYMNLWRNTWWNLFYNQDYSISDVGIDSCCLLKQFYFYIQDPKVK